MHPESLKLLKLLNVNIENVYKYLGFLMARHYDLCNNRASDYIIPERELFEQIKSIDEQQIDYNHDNVPFDQRYIDPKINFHFIEMVKKQQSSNINGVMKLTPK